MGKASLKQPWPLALSLFLHVILILLLVVAFVPEPYRSPGPVDPKAVIQVKTVSAAVLAQQQRAREQAIKRLQDKKKLLAKLKQQRIQQAKAKRLAEMRRKKLRQQAEAKRLADAKKALLRQKAAKKRARLKAIQEKKRKALLAERQRLAKKMLAEQLKAVQEKKRKALLAERQRLAKKIMSEQLKREALQLQQQRARQQQGVINAYVPKILSAIGQEWLLPPSIDRHLSCLYQINLAPGGVVVGVKLLNSSGNAALDRSANQAIWSASPLPVPKNPALFDKLRVLRLTMRPENVVSNG